MKNLKLSNGIKLINKKFKKNEYYHYFDCPDLSVVIPKFRNRYILVSQKRIPINKKNYEFPSGMIEKNEKPIDCANKELIEETGYTSIKKLNNISFFYTEPGRLNNKIYGYYTDKLKKISLPEKGIEINFFTRTQILDLINKGKFNCASHIAMFFLSLKIRE